MCFPWIFFFGIDLVCSSHSHPWPDSWSPPEKVGSSAEPPRQSTNLCSGHWEEFRPGLGLTGRLMKQNTHKYRDKSQYFKSKRFSLRLQTILYSKQSQIVFIIYWRPCDTVRVKKRLKLGLTALLWYMKTDVNVTSFLCPAFSAHVSRQGMEKHNNFPL